MEDILSNLITNTIDIFGLFEIDVTSILYFE